MSRLVFWPAMAVSRRFVSEDFGYDVGKNILSQAVVRSDPGKLQRVENDERDIGLGWHLACGESRIIPDVDRAPVFGMEPQMPSVCNVHVRTERLSEIDGTHQRIGQSCEHIVYGSGHQGRFAAAGLAKHQHQRRADDGAVEQVQSDKSSGRRGAKGMRSSGTSPRGRWERGRQASERLR